MGITIKGIPSRYVLCFLEFLGMFHMFALLLNMSVALVAMVNTPQIWDIKTYIPEERNSSAYKELRNGTIEQNEKVYSWDENTQGLILSAFYYGFVPVNFFGGRLAEKFGAKVMLGGGVLLTSVLTLLTPCAADLGSNAIVVVRVFVGACQGVVIPAVHTMAGRWYPKSERSFLYAVVSTGSMFGNVVGYPLSGYLCQQQSFLGGWPSVFYVFGTSGVIWFVFWWIFVFETPADHPRISLEELQFIIEDQGKDQTAHKNPEVPWKDILTSVPFLSNVFSDFLRGFCTLLIRNDSPIFLSYILNFDLASLGLMNALPSIFAGMSMCISGFITDWLISKKEFNPTKVRKTVQAIASILPSVCLAGVILSGHNRVQIVIFLVATTGTGYINYSGAMAALIDMSPVFAGTLMGISNGAANLNGFIAPLVVGTLTENNQTKGQWNIIFFMCICANCLSMCSFCIFGSSEIQPWGIVKTNKATLNVNEDGKQLENKNSSDNKGQSTKL